MKNSKYILKRKGISLVVLVIEIIVIAALAAAVILMANNNPIENANKASFQNDLMSIQEEVDMYISSKKVDSLGQDVEDTFRGDEMVSTFESTNKYKDKISIVDGLVVIKKSATDQEKEWAEELGIRVGD